MENTVFIVVLCTAIFGITCQAEGNLDIDPAVSNNVTVLLELIANATAHALQASNGNVAGPTDNDAVENVLTDMDVPEVKVLAVNSTQNGTKLDDFDLTLDPEEYLNVDMMNSEQGNYQARHLGGPQDRRKEVVITSSDLRQGNHHRKYFKSVYDNGVINSNRDDNADHGNQRKMSHPPSDKHSKSKSFYKSYDNHKDLSSKPYKKSYTYKKSEESYQVETKPPQYEVSYSSNGKNQYSSDNNQYSSDNAKYSTDERIPVPASEAAKAIFNKMSNDFASLYKSPQDGKESSPLSSMFSSSSMSNMYGKMLDTLDFNNFMPIYNSFMPDFKQFSPQLIKPQGQYASINYGRSFNKDNQGTSDAAGTDEQKGYYSSEQGEQRESTVIEGQGHYKEEAQMGKETYTGGNLQHTHQYVKTSVPEDSQNSPHLRLKKGNPWIHKSRYSSNDHNAYYNSQKNSHNSHRSHKNQKNNDRERTNDYQNVQSQGKRYMNKNKLFDRHSNNFNIPKTNYNNQQNQYRRDQKDNIHQRHKNRNGHNKYYGHGYSEPRFSEHSNSQPIQYYEPKTKHQPNAQSRPRISQNQRRTSGRRARLRRPNDRGRNQLNHVPGFQHPGAGTKTHTLEELMSAGGVISQFPYNEGDIGYDYYDEINLGKF